MTDTDRRRLALVADDEADLVNVLRFRLERSGFDVLTAVDGEEALALARSNDLDIAILDGMMPRRSGFEVLRELRGNPATRDLPVILLTARAQESDIDEGFDAGASDYVTKPFSPQELLARVHRQLGDRAPRG
jgi:DNA-binding response OmpR family regulator